MYRNRERYEPQKKQCLFCQESGSTVHLTPPCPMWLRYIRVYWVCCQWRNCCLLLSPPFLPVWLLSFNKKNGESRRSPSSLQIESIPTDVLDFQKIFNYIYCRYICADIWNNKTDPRTQAALFTSLWFNGCFAPFVECFLRTLTRLCWEKSKKYIPTDSLGPGRWPALLLWECKIKRVGKRNISASVAGDALKPVSLLACKWALKQFGEWF